jgi:hypothetical protein
VLKRRNKLSRMGLGSLGNANGLLVAVLRDCDYEANQAWDEL